jgi:hypothetical protein
MTWRASSARPWGEGDYIVLSTHPENPILRDGAKAASGAVRTHARFMTKCVKVLRAKAKPKSMDQSQARIKTVPSLFEPVIGPFVLLSL